MGKKASFQKVEQQQQKRSFCPFFFRPPKIVRRKNEWTRGVKKTKRGGGRRRRRRGFALTRRSKNLPIVGIVVTISPSLSLYKMVVLPAASRPTCVRFPRETKRTNLFGQYTREKFAYANAFHPFKTTDATPRRGEAADVPPHRISQNPKKKIPASFSSGRCPSTTFIRAARNSKSNPLPHHHHRECRSVRFDDESNPL